MRVKLNNNPLYAILLYFPISIGCSLPSSQLPPTPDSQAQTIQKEYQNLRESFETLQARSFELEAYMDTARQNLENGNEWPEEKAEIQKRFDLLEEELQNTATRLEELKHSLAIQDEAEQLESSEPNADN